MKLAVKKVDACKRQVKFEVPKDRVNEKMEEVFKDLGKSAKIKGFRPGKIPRAVLEAELGALAREETIKKIIPEVLHEGFTKEGLEPLDMPEIHDVAFKDGVVSFTAIFDVKPDINIGKYKGIKVVRKSSKVSDEEIDKTLDYFKNSQGQDKETVIDDNFAKGLGYPTLDDFKKSLASQLAIEKDRQNRFDVENQIVESLLKESKFSVPQDFLNKQLEKRVADAKKRFETQGVPEEEITKREKDMRKEMKDAVERDVKAYLLLDKIAEIEKLEFKEGQNMPRIVMEMLMKEADWQESS